MTHAMPDDPKDTEAAETDADEPKLAETELAETKLAETKLAETKLAETDAVEADGMEADADAPTRRRIDWARVLAYGVLPTIAFVLAGFAGVTKYVDSAMRDDTRAGAQAMATATSTTVAMLSYTPDDVDHELNAASNLLTGDFRGQYLGTIHNTVIPGAQQRQISAVTRVPAAAVVSATGHQAVVMLYLDQTVTVGSDAPTVTLSSARATLNEVDGTWLISEFALT